MVNYRRNKMDGGIYFFTVALKDRRSTILTSHISYLSNAINQVKAKHPFKTHAIVVLPEHLHVIWQLPENDNNYSMRWKQIKSKFTQSMLSVGMTLRKNQRGEYDLWQRRFWEHTILHENDFEAHINYIHYNPIKHKLVTVVKNWPYSSFHRYVKQGILPLNWSHV